MTRTATARWEGSGKEGKGTMNADSGIFNNTPYSFVTRFEQKEGTSPEELLAAAHAGCFSMKLAFELGAAGYTPKSIETRCGITLGSSGITTSALQTTVSVDGLDEAEFRKIAEKAKAECPVSQLYNCEITLDAKLA